MAGATFTRYDAAQSMRVEAMKKRSRAGGEPVKTRRRKEVTAKRRKEPKSARRRGSSAADQKAEVARLTRELNEALERQTATADILRVISSSPGDLQPVFEAILENATRICEAKLGNLWLREGDKFRIVAIYGGSPEYCEYLFAEPLVIPDAQSTMGRVASNREVVQIDDISKAPTYGMRMRIATIKIAKARTLVGVPMLKDNEVVGIIGIYRQEVRPFTDKQIALVQSFAAQAVIAIENARLLNELRESLQQQTATADVLKVISRSTFDLQAVLDTLVESAARLCDADNAAIHRQQGDSYPYVASYGLSREFDEFMRERLIVPGRGTVLGRVVIGRRAIHVHDVEIDPEYKLTEAQRIGGFHTALGIPLLREGMLIGVIMLTRNKVRPFNDKQIELATTFADQAVIAIENVRLFEAEQQRTRELTELLEQQTATSEVLQVISSSPGDLQPVFETMLENAARICVANFGNIHRWDGNALHLMATHNTPSAFAEYRGRSPWHPKPRNAVGRTIATKTVVHVADLAAEEAYTERGDPSYVAAVELGGVRTFLAVPMLKENELIGVFTVYRKEVRPFTDKQIALVQNFASQAVIAIENTRLLNELRQRTDDLAESLEQQTATSDVLGVISRSKFELQPILQSVVDTAARLCRAEGGVIFRREDGIYRFAAGYSLDPAYLEIERKTPIVPGQGTVVGRAAITGQVARIDDAWTDPLYEKKQEAKIGKGRSMIGVPLMREGEPIGVIGLARSRVDPFTEREIDLVATFADQAVIAIENVRLFEAEQQRSRELTELLEQQTATSEVLQVISSSPGDLEPVFGTMLTKAVRICDARFGNIFRWDGDALHLLATHNVPFAFDDVRRRLPLRPSPGTPIGRMVATRTVVHVTDLAGDKSYIERAPSVVAAVELGGIRTFLAVPMLKEGELIGAFTLNRPEVRPFTEKEIALVTSFAAQAVIAIENARLLSELRQRTDELGRSVGELRALGEVSQAVNSTLDIETVLSTIVAKAVQLSGTDAGAIYVFDELEREFRLRATYGMDQELIDALRQQHIGMDEPNVERAFAEGEPIQVADLREDAPSPANEIVLRAGYRARLAAPLMRGEEIVGMLVVRRRTPGAFPPNIVDLMKTFAAQSALAIENARLFNNVETSLKDLRTAQDRLVQTEKLASLGQLTAGIAHEIKNPLNFVNNFSAVSVELIDELREALGGAHLDSKLRAEIAGIADMLQGNLDKVVQHGKRADSIVKNMLLHSRQGSGEHRPVDINALVEESLNLAYHGARAEKQGFNITLERSFDPAAGEVDLFPQEITRVLLNLISNGFYAATKRKAEANGGDYEPTLAAATKNLGDRVEIRIRDNGTGIPPEVKEKLFNPFFTTKASR